jgi:hypothetical protein
MYVIYLYDHKLEKWVYLKEFNLFASAVLYCGFKALDGYDVSLVDVNTSHFDYFWSL